jgi:hypothetical protein
MNKEPNDFISSKYGMPGCMNAQPKKPGAQNTPKHNRPSKSKVKDKKDEKCGMSQELSRCHSGQADINDRWVASVQDAEKRNGSAFEIVSYTLSGTTDKTIIQRYIMWQDGFTNRIPYNKTQNKQ